jgi:hypothetical protein
MEANTIVRVYQDATDVLVPSAAFFNDQLAEGAGYAADAEDAAAGAAESKLEAETAAASATGSAAAAGGVRDAIQAQIDGFPGAAGQTIPVANRDVLAAVTALAGPAYDYEDDAYGHFKWTGGDQSARVTAYGNRGFAVPPSSATSGGSGAWIRIGELKPQHFASYVMGPSVDCRPELQKFWNAVYAENRSCDATGDFGIAGTLTLGPSTSPGLSDKYVIRGNHRLTQLTATLESVRLKNLCSQHWRGKLGITGIGSTSFASRTCGVGIAVENCGGLVFSGGVKAEKFWMAGLLTDPVNQGTDGMEIPFLRTFDCGSGHSVGSLTANWSSPSNSGSAGSVGQRTVLSVDALPPATLETYAAIGAQQFLVRINGTLRYVYGWDRTAGTITIYPWLDFGSAAIGSGTLQYIIGGGAVFMGSDNGTNLIGYLHALRAGIALADGSLYGQKVPDGNAASCGIAVCMGLTPNSSHQGHKNGMYIEGTLDHEVMIPRMLGAAFAYNNDGYATDLAKCRPLGDPLGADGYTASNGFGSPNTGGAMTVAAGGRINRWIKPSIAVGYGSTFIFREQREPPKVLPQSKDSQTINLTVQGTGEYDRGFGYTGCTLRYFGSGANNAPTGSFTFTPPTQTYANAVTTSGSAVVTIGTAGAWPFPTAGLLVGMPISGTGIPGGATILSVNSATQITMSANATASGTVTMTATGRINGAFANAVFSNFDGAADFEVNHKDHAQLDWVVSCVAGQIKASLAGVDVRAAVNISLSLSTSKATQYFNSAITATRTVTMPAPGNVGRRFRIVRSANATGAGALNINTSGAVLIKALTVASTWADVEDDGTEYRLMASGTL